MTAKRITVYNYLIGFETAIILHTELSYIVTLSCPLATKLEFPTSYTTHSAFKYSSKR